MSGISGLVGFCCSVNAYKCHKLGLLTILINQIYDFINMIIYHSYSFWVKFAVRLEPPLHQDDTMGEGVDKVNRTRFL